MPRKQMKCLESSETSFNKTSTMSGALCISIICIHFNQILRRRQPSNHCDTHSHRSFIVNVKFMINQEITLRIIHATDIKIISIFNCVQIMTLLVEYFGMNISLIGNGNILILEQNLLEVYELIKIGIVSHLNIAD